MTDAGLDANKLFPMSNTAMDEFAPKYMIKQPRTYWQWYLDVCMQEYVHLYPRLSAA